jgi:hypothetical protein
MFGAPPVELRPIPAGGLAAVTDVPEGAHCDLEAPIADRTRPASQSLPVWPEPRPGSGWRLAVAPLLDDRRATPVTPRPCSEG